MTLEANNQWNICINGDRVTLTRMNNGRAVEAYRPTSKEGALLDLALIIQGYQPARNLPRLDELTD